MGSKSGGTVTLDGCFGPVPRASSQLCMQCTSIGCRPKKTQDEPKTNGPRKEEGSSDRDVPGTLTRRVLSGLVLAHRQVLTVGRAACKERSAWRA